MPEQPIRSRTGRTRNFTPQHEIMILRALVLSIFSALFALSAAATGAAEILWLDAARASITTGELRNHVGLLADDMLEGREAGSRGSRAAARYIIHRLQEAALKPGGVNGRYVQPFQGVYQNLLAMLEGHDPQLKQEYIVVGAHYDHVGYGNRSNSYGPWGYIHNGADDNASGVSTLLEVIDALTRTTLRPRRSILFAFWDGEEKGLLGSKHWIRQPSVPLEDVRMAINIDMVGRLSEGRIEVMGSRTGRGLRQQMSTTRLAGDAWIDFTWEIKDNSDHWPFIERDIPSVCLHTGVHDDYHRPSDDVEKLNIEGMRTISSYLLEQLCELADTEQLPAFRRQATQETSRMREQTERPLPELAPRLDFTWVFQTGEPSFVLVQSIKRDSREDNSELRVGDKIVSIDGNAVTSESALPAVTLRSEESVSLEILRVGEDAPISVSAPLSGKPIRLGLSWRDNEAEPGAVIVTRVVPHSPAAAAGIKVHDRIYALDGKPIKGQDHLFEQVQTRLAEEAPEINLQVESRGIVRDVVVPMGIASTFVEDPTL